MPSKDDFRVLIVGGSVAGLALANILEKIGVDFVVLEKYGKIAPDLGASIGIFPNGFRIIDQLGCHDAVRRLVDGADSFERLGMYNEHGKLVQEIPNASQHFEQR
jgi:2-polyprenyl-6-methoxyphenol hydroxylase-like FAD-dependent oxidoreductase